MNTPSGSTKCPVCYGTGKSNNGSGKEWDCNICQGTGTIARDIHVPNKVAADSGRPDYSNACDVLLEYLQQRVGKEGKSVNINDYKMWVFYKAKLEIEALNKVLPEC